MVIFFLILKHDLNQGDQCSDVNFMVFLCSRKVSSLPWTLIPGTCCCLFICFVLDKGSCRAPEPQLRHLLIWFLSSKKLKFTGWNPIWKFIATLKFFPAMSLILPIISNLPSTGSLEKLNSVNQICFWIWERHHRLNSLGMVLLNSLNPYGIDIKFGFLKKYLRI